MIADSFWLIRADPRESAVGFLGPSLRDLWSSSMRLPRTAVLGY